MFPTLLKLGPFELSTYGVLVAAGYLAGIRWLQTRRGDMGLSEDDFWSLIYWLFGGALVGGKVLYLIVDGASVDWSHPAEALRFGFVFYGGFLGSALAGLIARRRLKFSYAKLSDWFGAALPLGHAIGRFGCLAAGCCYGAHTDLPWGVPLAGDPSRHPTQLYESLANFAIFLLVARVGLPRVRAGRWKPGSAFLLYIGAYAVARFALEFLRDDPRGGVGVFSASQAVALAALFVVGAVAARRRA